MSKTILIPTDYSKGARAALNYAAALAKKTKAKLILLHAFHFIYPISEIPVERDREDLSMLRRKEQEKLKKLSMELAKTQKIKCDFLCREGLAMDVILDVINEESPNLVIMGTKGASGVKEILMGSNTAKVIEKAKCPVLAVPQGVLFKGINKITFATDYHMGDFPVLKDLADMAKPFNARITVIHVSDGGFTQDAEEIGMERFKRLITTKIRYPKISFQVLYGKNLENILQEHIKKQGIDLLAMSTRERNLFERLFGASSTKRMAYHTSVPLIAFHHKKESVIFI